MPAGLLVIEPVPGWVGADPHEELSVISRVSDSMLGEEGIRPMYPENVIDLAGREWFFDVPLAYCLPNPPDGLPFPLDHLGS